jgi:hypothetical protein
MRPFTRQQRLHALRPAPAAGLTFPAYIFDCLFGISQSPFGSALPASLGFYATRGAILAHRPLLCPLPKRSVCRFAVTPLQNLSILRDHSTQPSPAGETCPYDSPDLPSLPATLQYLITAPQRINVPAPLLLVWLAVPGALPYGVRTFLPPMPYQALTGKLFTACPP